MLILSPAGNMVFGSKAKKIADLLEKDFPSYVPKTPKYEDDLHLLVYMYLKMKYSEKIQYTGGKKGSPDIIIEDIPVEIKLTKSSTAVTQGINQLFNYMKGTKWNEGVLLIWDTSTNKVAYNTAKQKAKNGKITKKFGSTERKIYIATIY